MATGQPPETVIVDDTRHKRRAARAAHPPFFDNYIMRNGLLIVC